jgi:hypothetical protein
MTAVQPTTDIWQQIAEGQQPAPQSVVDALLQAEKHARQTRQRYDYSQLVGVWQLRFITGTKRTRQKAGVVLGAGRWIPGWVKIQIAYKPADIANEGTVDNSVQLGALKLTVSGPTLFWPQQNLLSFDFPHVNFQVGAMTLYAGYPGKGAEKAANFHSQPIKKQAFFNYFLIQENLIAARGRGGGLAIWVRA